MIWMLQWRPLSSFYLSLTSDRVSLLIPLGGGWNPSVVSLSVLCNTRQIIRLSQRHKCILQVSVIQVSILLADFTRHWHHHIPACSCPWLHKYSQWHSGLHPIPHLLRHLRMHMQVMRERKKEGALTNKYTAPVKDRGWGSHLLDWLLNFCIFGILI